MIQTIGKVFSEPRKGKCYKMTKYQGKKIMEFIDKKNRIISWPSSSFYDRFIYFFTNWKLYFLWKRFHLSIIALYIFCGGWNSF